MANRAFKIFLASGTWVCPPGVTSVILIGFGGGGGGGGGGPSSTVAADNGCGGGGGGGATQKTYTMTVVPGTTYTVVIGAAGYGGSAGQMEMFGSGGNGGYTWFTAGSGDRDSVRYFAGGEGGVASNESAINANRVMLGGAPSAYAVDLRYYSRIDASDWTEVFVRLQPGQGGGGFNKTAETACAAALLTSLESPYGKTSVEGHSGNYGGFSGTTFTRSGGGGGGGGGGGPNGVGGYGGPGGNGSAAGTGAIGTVGESAFTANGFHNTGAGGGGGGCGGQGAIAGTSAAGGAGGTGKLTIIWDE